MQQKHGVLAQLGEHLPYKQRVIGSSPIGPIPIKYGGIAQLARACGSYPQCRGFESPFRYCRSPQFRLRAFVSAKTPNSGWDNALRGCEAILRRIEVE